MVTVSVGNSYSKISGFNASTFTVLRKALSYVPAVNASVHSGLKFGRRKLLIGTNGHFPTGLLSLALKTLHTAGVQYTVTDTRIVPRPLKTLFHRGVAVTPYPAQEDAVEACISRQHGCVVMPTGTGKSLTMVLLCESLHLPTLIVVPTVGLREQLRATFKHYFGSLDYVTIQNIDSPELQKPSKYDVLIIDEAHHVAAATYQKLNRKQWAGIYHRYFFTATPFRSKSEENIVFEAIAGEVIYRLSYQNAVKLGYIVPIEAYYIELPKVVMEGEENNWRSVYSELVVNNAPANEVITSILAKLAGTSHLCLVKEIKHGKTLQNATRLPFASGEGGDAIKLIESFNDGSTGLIATTGVAGEGVDTRPCEWVLLAGGGKSKNLLMQMIGRGVRRFDGKDSCKVIMFKNPSHKYLLRHFKECVKVLREEYGLEPIKLEI